LKPSSSQPKHKVIFLLGPTSSGKTKLSLDLAESFHGEIVNIDSQQAIKDLDIATAKISKLEMKGIKHHMLDVFSFEEEENVYNFSLKAEDVIYQILENDKIPVVVGGTGLYARVLSGSIALKEETEQNGPLRKDLDQLPLDKLIEHAKGIDLWAQLNDSDRHNKRRLIRIIEKKSSSIGTSESKKRFLSDVAILKLALAPSADLDQKILKNVTFMVKNGLVEETVMLLKKYPNFEQKVKAIGYKETIAFIKGEIATKEELIALIALHTRQYAKRQVTWLKKEPNIVWVKNTKEAKAQVISFLQGQ
jgi:tRNA dimethylallyltransferase